MSYLARLKVLEGQKIFAHGPEPVPPKLTKGASVSSVSTAQGTHAKTRSPIDQGKEFTNAPQPVVPKLPEAPAAFDREAFEERAAIMEFDGELTRAEAERLALTAGLERRIKIMAAWWRYPPADLDFALRGAVADPAAWLELVEFDAVWRAAHPSDRPEGEARHA